jgi:hypothetical protein
MAACLPARPAQGTAHSCTGAAGDQDRTPAAWDAQLNRFSAAYSPILSFCGAWHCTLKLCLHGSMSPARPAPRNST